ncbi:hypothetical protein, partial [Klebsiella pneumoniae]|uniref:hypothetical protein n=1 Tax=Klebsiella pneumoniae TaxID=573 RepID=UPI0015E0AD64
VLAQGVYDDFLPDPNIMDFTPNVNPSAACNGNLTWCSFKVIGSYGGTVVRTRVPNGSKANDAAKMTFNIHGTGFSVITLVRTTGTDMRICYRPTASSTTFLPDTTPFPPDTVNSTASTYTGTGANDVFCELVTTNTLAAEWAAKNPG